MKPGILVIVGPTASGKKHLAMKVAELFDSEIVSADSRKVYRYLDIGTAKPSPEDRKTIPHHLIDIVNPDEPFSAGEWVRLASEAVSDILARERLPIISGGTGFYIEAFQHGLTESIVSDPDVRERLELECAEKGSQAMYRKLEEIDPDRAAELHEHDKFRVMKALEVYHITGRTFTELRKEPRISGGDYDCFLIGMDMDRKALYGRIEERVDNMISDGLVDELERVLNMRYSRDLTALNSLGYKELFPYIDGEESLENCIEQVKRNTRRYAKRQITWFRARPHVNWIDASDDEDMKRVLDTVRSWIAERS